IVDALRLRLTPNEDKRLAQHPLADVRAYEYYLLARQEIWTFNAQSLDHALQLVRRAQAIVGDNELLFVAEGLIYWQTVNAGMVAMLDGNSPAGLAWTQRAAAIAPANPTRRRRHAMMRAAIGHRDEGRAMLDGVGRDTSPMAWARLAPAMACALRGGHDKLLR